jgi:hypothetical protein
MRSSLFLFGTILLPTFLIPDRDVARGTYGSRALVLSLGNPDTQIGAAWLCAVLIGVFFTSTVTDFTFKPVLFETSKKHV